MRVFYFTGTGNSLQVARAIGEGGELVSIPLFLREHQIEIGVAIKELASSMAPADAATAIRTNGDTMTGKRIIIKDDAVGLVFPTYYWEVPAIVVEFLEKVKIESDYFFVLTTRGVASVTLKSNLRQIARRNGHCLSYYSQISMPDNFLPLCNMTNQKKRFTASVLAQSIGLRVTDVRARKSNVRGPTAPGFLVSAGSSIIRAFTGGTKPASESFLVDANCTGCGICAKACSAQSIKIVEDMPVFSSTCNDCLACVHLCTTGALHMRKEKTSERYLNPTIKKDDIIEAHSPQRLPVR
ncbi:MAG: EFR1 family ferrodoxin [Coriobacteriia bacterium]|nr:EFR1 family ferrodoxin [Coriobacteriia bacterium]